DERDVAQHARLVQNPNDEHLALAVGDLRGIEGGGGLFLLARHELDKALSFATRSLDCLDVDSDLTQNRAEASKSAGCVLHCHCELDSHRLVPSAVSTRLLWIRRAV